MKQIIVTKKGQGIIPKAIANGEVIKFTKVCISDKDYSGVELCNLEKIESVKQEVKTDYVHIISDTQIEVVCSVDNENLENAYYIKTIGIYAVDSNGNEVLYGVSISDSVSDYMPKYEGKTLTGILYRLIINIGNAENVVTDINNATVANVLEVKLIEKRVSDIEKRVEKVEKDATQFSNPNLLINSNFRVSQLVNQREKNIYNGYGYGIDMWKFEGGGVNYELSLTEGFVKIKNNASVGYLNFAQSFENTNFSGTYTMSTRIKGEIGKTVALIFNADGVQKALFHTFTTNDWEVVTMTQNINTTMTDIILRPGANSIVYIDYIKLEKGNIATPFIDDDPATKLAKCQRYLQIIDRNNYDYILHGEIRSTYIDFLFYINKMRINPSVIFENTLGVYASGIKQTGFTFEAPLSRTGLLLVRATKNAHGITALDCTVLEFNYSKAKILLSAEM